MSITEIFAFLLLASCIVHLYLIYQFLKDKITEYMKTDIEHWEDENKNNDENWKNQNIINKSNEESWKNQKKMNKIYIENFENIKEYLKKEGK